MRGPRRFNNEEPAALSLPWIHILLALADGDLHGYAIMRDVEERTEGAVTLWPATLYGAIKRMLAADLIRRAPAPSADEDPRRRYYRLTPLGRRVLQHETARLERLVKAARQRNVLGKTTST